MFYLALIDNLPVEENYLTSCLHNKLRIALLQIALCTCNLEQMHSKKRLSVSHFGASYSVFDGLLRNI